MSAENETTKPPPVLQEETGTRERLAVWLCEREDDELAWDIQTESGRAFFLDQADDALAAASLPTGGRQLLECEEALRSLQAEHEAFRAQQLAPLNASEGRSIESLTWDELLGVANRNLNFGLELDAKVRDALEHYANGPDRDPDDGLIARHALAALNAWPSHASSTGDGEWGRHEASMARGLWLQADFIAAVRAALGARRAEFTDRQIWQEALRFGPIEPADLASRLAASSSSVEGGGGADPRREYERVREWARVHGVDLPGSADEYAEDYAEAANAVADAPPPSSVETGGTAKTRYEVCIGLAVADLVVGMPGLTAIEFVTDRRMAVLVFTTADGCDPVGDEARRDHLGFVVAEVERLTGRPVGSAQVLPARPPVETGDGRELAVVSWLLKYESARLVLERFRVHEQDEGQPGGRAMRRALHDVAERLLDMREVPAPSSSICEHCREKPATMCDYGPWLCGDCATSLTQGAAPSSSPELPAATDDEGQRAPSRLAGNEEGGDGASESGQPSPDTLEVRDGH